MALETKTARTSMNLSNQQQTQKPRVYLRATRASVAGKTKVDELQTASVL